VIRVLIVDDSVVFRTQIAAAVGRCKEIEVAGTAATGSIALQRLTQLQVDVVTLDMEMPEMNGIDVLREIRARKIPVKVIIFSSQTQRGAEAALLALREGADDVVAKPSGEGMTIETAGNAIAEALNPKILQFSRAQPLPPGGGSTQSISTPKASGVVPPASVVATNQKRKELGQMKWSALVIGSSTGGPAALERIFKTITAPVSIPIFLVQHMPPVFTQILAKRIQEISGIPAGEAKHGEVIVPNRLYVAPGDYHMVLDKSSGSPQLLLNQEPQRNSVRPAVDSLFESAATIYGSGCLGVVLTGMGEDGWIGAKAIRAVGGGVLIQDRESSVVFGMPGAVFNGGDYDQIGDLTRIEMLLRQLTRVPGGSV
jgi:two-component system chemotaxis response regulator CheB